MICCCRLGRVSFLEIGFIGVLCRLGLVGVKLVVLMVKVVRNRVLVLMMWVLGEEVVILWW